MFEQIFRVLVLLSLFSNAILASGSSRNHHQDDQLVRDPRHAPCLSCRRERPDALVSWYSQPASRDYRTFESDADGWPSSQHSRQQHQSDSPYFSSPYDSYERAARSRGAQYATRLGSTCKRENPFAFQRDVNFDLAPSQTAHVRSMKAPTAMYPPDFQVPRIAGRSVYVKPSFYSTISRQSDLTSSDRYSDYGPSRDKSSFEGFASSNFYDGPDKRTYSAYRTSDYPDRLAENERPVVRPQQYPTRPSSIPVSHLSLGGKVDQRASESSEFFPSRREQSQDSTMVFAPQIKHNPYNLPPDLNIYKMMQNIGREAAAVAADDSGSKDQFKVQKEQELETRPLRIEEYEDQQGARLVQEMNEDNDDRRRNGEFRSRGSDQQEEVKGRRDAPVQGANVEILGRSHVARNKLTEASSTTGLAETSDRVTKPEAAEPTTKTVIAA